MLLKHSKAWGIDHLSRKPISVFKHLSLKKYFLMASLNLPRCSFELFPHVLSLDTRENDHIPLHFLSRGRHSSPSLFLCLALLHPKVRSPTLKFYPINCSSKLQCIQIPLQGILSLKWLNNTSHFAIIGKISTGAHSWAYSAYSWALNTLKHACADCPSHGTIVLCHAFCNFQSQFVQAFATSRSCMTLLKYSHGPIAMKLCLFMIFFPAWEMSSRDVSSSKLSQFTAWFKENMKHFRDSNF